MESLYRKYRPLTFESVVGQQHIVSTLKHAVAEGRLSHAYLFCGPRGTGKTTMARILAKSLLCEGSEAARATGASGCMPDGTCPECEAIAAGTHPDVYELDAASRTGVDNVREEIINSVSFAPVRGAYKVYIIDEVHMLTTAAFNALLKTLEEPPSHVVFVLCTTDPQKILETILSRCQRFDFHRISNEDIVGRLRFICEQEGFAFDEEALEIVARHARGGMRDALSTLEQLSVFGDGSVRVDDARSLLGEVASTVLSEFACKIAVRDTVGLFGLVRVQADEGNDLMELTHDLVARRVYRGDCGPQDRAVRRHARGGRGAGGGGAPVRGRRSPGARAHRAGRRRARDAQRVRPAPGARDRADEARAPGDRFDPRGAGRASGPPGGAACRWRAERPHGRGAAGCRGRPARWRSERRPTRRCGDLPRRCGAFGRFCGAGGSEFRLGCGAGTRLLPDCRSVCDPGSRAGFEQPGCRFWRGGREPLCPLVDFRVRCRAPFGSIRICPGASTGGTCCRGVERSGFRSDRCRPRCSRSRPGCAACNGRRDASQPVGASGADCLSSRLADGVRRR